MHLRTTESLHVIYSFVPKCYNPFLKILKGNVYFSLYISVNIIQIPLCCCYYVKINQVKAPQL